MNFSVEQIVYTSFANIGFKSVVSPLISPEIEQAFITNIVQQYWDSYNPPKSGYRAVYLQQISLEQTFFGWLYNDGHDDLKRSHIPYFISYFLVGRLGFEQLNILWNCLEVGPVTVIDRQNPFFKIKSVIIPDSCHYQSARLGVGINSSLRRKSQKSLQKGQLINQFIEEDFQLTSLPPYPSNNEHPDEQLANLQLGLQSSEEQALITPIIEKILQDLAINMIGIQGVALVSQGGQLITAPIGLNKHSISIISEELLYVAQTTYHQFDWQNIEMISLRWQEGHIILAYCHPEIFLLIKAEKVLTGLLEGEINRTVKKIQKVFLSSDFSRLSSGTPSKLLNESVSADYDDLEELEEQINQATTLEFPQRKEKRIIAGKGIKARPQLKSQQWGQIMEAKLVNYSSTGCCLIIETLFNQPSIKLITLYELDFTGFDPELGMIKAKVVWSRQLNDFLFKLGLKYLK